MGVLGLTTFLHENRRSLSKTFQHTYSVESTTTPVIVDGWSFIYKLYYDSYLPWVYGGEYTEFSSLVIRTVQAWINVGFEVYFVFDGPRPEIKFPTMTTRLTEKQIHHSLLFFRTSTSSRNTGRFLNETRIIPSLAFSACVQSLQSIAQESNGLHVHFADEEGDPFAVELAGRIGGYVIGNDSDFVILNSEGYKGYIPLDEMVWSIPESLDVAPNENSDGEFRTVRKAKTKKKASSTGAGRGVIPPDGNAQDLALTFCAYSPESLAAHLKIPAALLPLLGAIVGNDFASRSENPSRNVRSLFFERQLSLNQRIERAASTIRNILSPDSSVMDLIDRTVNTLLSRWTTTIRSSEIDKIIEGIVNATLQYAIPKHQGSLGGKESLWPTEVCALHDPGTCPLVPFFSHLFEDDDMNIMDEDSQSKIKLRGLTASYWPRLFLENPDMETVGRSIGRPIRTWVYSILADSLVSDTNGDDHELVDVEEAKSDDEVDLLAPLKGDLRRLHQPEHIRRGIRIAEEIVDVMPLNDLLSIIEAPFQSNESAPLLLRPQTDALTVLLLRALERENLTIALSLRWRAQETNSKDRDQERWSKREARCFLATFIIAKLPLLTAQILASLASISELANVLLISNLVPAVSRLFSGRKFHALLTGIIPLADSPVTDPLWGACQEGLEHVFMEGKRTSGKKIRKEHPPMPAAAHAQGSLFTLLAEGSA
ncbi:hypothetical protein F5887DRAFT_1061584 [Amanita rubescens]|nr:hypothetical protein F5887DRAFT_1061584 [Amanita rubescens]